MFSRPQVIENSTECFLLRTDILQKTVVECPLHFCHLLPTCDVSSLAIPEFCAHNICLRLLEDHSLAVSFFIHSPDCFSPQFQTPLHLCVRDLELESSLVYISQTSAIYFCLGFSCCLYYRSVHYIWVSVRRESCMTVT